MDTIETRDKPRGTASLALTGVTEPHQTHISPHAFLTGNDGHPPLLVSPTAYVFIAEGMKPEIFQLKSQRHVDVLALHMNIPITLDLLLQQRVTGNFSTLFLTLPKGLSQQQVQDKVKELISNHALLAENRFVYGTSGTLMCCTPYDSHYPLPQPPGVEEYKPFTFKVSA